jgi:hypothetical protein
VLVKINFYENTGVQNIVIMSTSLAMLIPGYKTAVFIFHHDKVGCWSACFMGIYTVQV